MDLKRKNSIFSLLQKSKFYEDWGVERLYSNNVREFKVNDFISLKLEGNRTNIYVKNQIFRQCMYLLLNISLANVKEYDTIESIDEAAVKLSRKMERNHRLVAPEVEFMGHCSNIQAWVENEYDTRILHRNLAFPLLKRLTDVGDPIAKKRFKEEIALRFASGHRTVQTFLKQKGYLSYLTAEEFEAMLDDLNLPIVDEVVSIINPLLKNINETDAKKTINLSINKLLRVFRFNFSYLVLLPVLKKFDSNYRQTLIEFLYKRFKKSRRFPVVQFIEKAQSYFDDLALNLVNYDDRLLAILINKELDLSHNNINNIMGIDGLDEIKDDIEVLNLSYNRISDINGLEKFRNLRILDLSYNERITEIPEILNELSSLEKVVFKGCRLKKFSDSTERFFWMNQNYQAYANYTTEEVRYYEKTHTGRAMSYNRVYKRFVVWLFKLRAIMKELNFSIKEIETYEAKTDNIALRAAKPTRAFKKWLFDRYQTKITSFIKPEQVEEKDDKNTLVDNSPNNNNISENQKKKIISALIVMYNCFLWIKSCSSRSFYSWLW